MEDKAQSNVEIEYIYQVTLAPALQIYDLATRHLPTMDWAGNDSVTLKFNAHCDLELRI